MKSIKVEITYHMLAPSRLKYFTLEFFREYNLSPSVCFDVLETRNFIEVQFTDQDYLVAELLDLSVKYIKYIADVNQEEFITRIIDNVKGKH